MKFSYIRGWLRKVILLAVFTATPWAPAASVASTPQTTADPAIAVEELTLLLTPLTRDELLVEAGGWQDLLRQKSNRIAALEVKIMQRNAQIEAAGAPADGQDDIKVATLEQVTELKEERTGLIDRSNAVLDELAAKTSDEDSDAQAKIRDYRLYNNAVSGIQVEVGDTTSAWIAVKSWLTSEQGGQRWALNFIRFFATLLVAWIIARLIGAVVRQALNRVSGTSRLLENFMVKATRWVVMAIGLVMALAALEISIGPLLAVVGAAGFAIAFALQDSLSNFASGLMILFFKPFDEGDVIEAGGVAGKVQSMNLVSTTIVTFDNKRMVVPNNKIWNDVITNVTGVTTRRVDMEFGIGYSDDIESAQDILLDIITNHPKVLKDPEPVVRMHALADSSVNFIARPWAQTSDYWDVYWDVTRAVKRRFDEAGIGIPFPQRDVHLYIEGDSDRSLATLQPKENAQQEGPAPEDGGLDQAT